MLMEPQTTRTEILLPSEILYTQNVTTQQFSDCPSVTMESVYKNLLYGRTMLADLPYIEVTKVNGRVWVVDGHKRLYVYKMLEKSFNRIGKRCFIICDVLDISVDEFRRLMTTITGGRFIHIREDEIRGAGNRLRDRMSRIDALWVRERASEFLVPPNHRGAPRRSSSGPGWTNHSLHDPTLDYSTSFNAMETFGCSPMATDSRGIFTELLLQDRARAAGISIVDPSTISVMQSENSLSAQNAVECASNLTKAATAAARVKSIENFTNNISVNNHSTVASSDSGCPSSSCLNPDAQPFNPKLAKASSNCLPKLRCEHGRESDERFNGSTGNDLPTQSALSSTHGVLTVNGDSAKRDKGNENSQSEQTTASRRSGGLLGGNPACTHGSTNVNNLYAQSGSKRHGRGMRGTGQKMTSASCSDDNILAVSGFGCSYSTDYGDREYTDDHWSRLELQRRDHYIGGHYTPGLYPYIDQLDCPMIPPYLLNAFSVL